MMFRELSKSNKKLSDDRCRELLVSQKRGVLSVVGDGGYPYGMPMNHYYDVNDGCIYFHCGIGGHRADALKQNDKVSYCVYDSGVRKDGEWVYTVNSVIVFGRMEIIDDRSVIERIAYGLCRKFTDDDEYIKREIEAFAHETLILKLTVKHMCGKTVREE